MSWNAEEHDPDYPFELLSTTFNLDPRRTALLIIDMQRGYVVIDGSSAIGEKYPDLARKYNQRIAQVVMPNTVRLLDVFRYKGLRVAYTRNGCMTSRGDEMTGRLRALHNPPKIWRGLPPYEIAGEICPHSEELVVDKLTSGAFTASPLEHALRNYGVTDVVVTGVFTDMCVLGTARVASELGFNTLICEDCCAALTGQSHNEALLNHARRFGRVGTAETIVEELSAKR